MKEPAIPEKIEIIAHPSALVIRRTWRSWHIIPLFFFCIAWDSFLIFWYTIALGGEKTPWIMILFPIGHIAVGIGLTYYLIACTFNKTDISVSPSFITVKSYPIFWGSEKRIGTNDITDTRIKYSASNNNRPSYGIRYRNRSNREHNIIRSGLDEDQAEYIDYHIRKTLGLKDEDSDA